jgi:quercetin dioxygenase-like cupin family protein
MLEKKYILTQSNKKVIEKVISDDFVHYNHMILPLGERLPEHYSNSNVYMFVVRGTLSIRLDDQEEHKYVKGSLLKIPNKVKMNVYNNDEEVLELTVVKAPAPGTF